MSVTTMLTKVEQDFESARSKAYDAIAELNKWASAGISGQYTNVYDPLDGNVYPIGLVTSADNMIATIKQLATEIGSIVYVPPTPITNFEMLDHKVWQDAFCEKVEAGLSAYMDTMGIPDASYQNAIFNESYDRNMQVLNDLMELADAKTGARGFTYPNSMTTALKLDAQQKYQFDRNQISRDITKLVTEWARQNYHMAIEKGIALETFHADFTYKYCTAFVDIYKTLVLASIEQFKAELGKYVEPIRALVEAAKLPVEVDKINADIQKANIDAFITSNKAKIEEQVAEYQSNVNVLINGFKTQIDALDSVAKQTAVMVQSAARSVIGIQK